MKAYWRNPSTKKVEPWTGNAGPRIVVVLPTEEQPLRMGEMPRSAPLRTEVREAHEWKYEDGSRALFYASSGDDATRMAREVKQ